MTEDSTAQLTS